MALPALPFSLGARVSSELNPVPMLVWFDVLEWWLLIGPAIFGIAWPVVVAILAVRRGWLPGWGRERIGCLALLVIALNLVVFATCASG